jgi:DNA polymerase elongation subunit (family B)
MLRQSYLYQKEHSRPLVLEWQIIMLCIVETVNIQCAVENFIKWLKKYNSVVLVAHNGRRFDFSVLVAAVSNVNKLEDFLASVEFSVYSTMPMTLLKMCAP